MVVAVAVLGGGIALYRSSAFSVRKVRVVGASHLKLSDVLAVAAVPADTTLLRLPDDAIRARLLKDPWIAEAEVVKRFPDTVELHLTERRGVALVEAAGAKWLVDTDGWVLEKHSAEATSSLPVVRDIEGLKPAVGKRATVAPLANALAVLRGIGKELRGMVRVVTAPSVDETALLTKEGVEVLIGPATQLDAKDAIARKILAAQRGKVVFIDVRTIERPVSRGLGQ
jgi:cell division protein FtsQ